jgi:ATP-dependent Zn protease
MTKRLTAAQREATAFHEAGHAVAAWDLGFPPDHLTIVPTDTTDGMLEYTNPLHGLDLDFDESDDAMRRKECAIMICLAGPEAQRLWRRRSWRARHGQSDIEHAVDVASSIHRPGHEVEPYIEHCRTKTERILIDRWPIVERLAQELLSRRTMSGAEVAAILSGCGGANADLK